jgi:hypothetical protein
VSTVPTPRKAHVPDYTDESAARNKNSEAVPPNLVQFVVESLVLCDKPELALVGGIFL